MSAKRGKNPFKRALITGAAGGIMSELSQRLADDGMDLILLDLDEKGLEKLRSNLMKKTNARSYVVDMTDLEGLEKMLHQIAEENGPVDLIVAGAGIDRPLTMESFDWRLGRDHFTINTVANYVICSVLIPRMIQQGGGHFIGIASLAAFGGFPYESAYCGSKAAFKSILESARAELSHTGVSFSTVCPGFVNTEMIAGNAYDVKDSAMDVKKAVEKIYRKAVVKQKAMVIFPFLTYISMCFLNLLPIKMRDFLARQQMLEQKANAD